jgi:hypothetical protein
LAGQEIPQVEFAPPSLPDQKLIRFLKGNCNMLCLSTSARCYQKLEVEHENFLYLSILAKFARNSESIAKLGSYRRAL